MYKAEKRKEQVEDTKNQKQLGNIIKVSIIIGIIVVSGFIIYYILTPEPGFVIFGFLNEEKKAENYPTHAKVNETVSFYVSVGNYMNRDFSFQVMIKKGNNETLMRPSFPSNGSLENIIGNFTLSNGGNWISEKLNISFSQIGNNQIIITELWQIKDNIPEYYTKLWLRLNIIN